MHSKINKSKHETKIMCLLIISKVHYSYYQGEIMMFDDCNSKNIPGQFTTAHISGCGYLYKHCRSQPFHKTVWCSNQTIDCMYLNAACSNNWRNMWLGWQILTFIKLQILFNLRHNILQYDCVHHKSYLVADVVPILITSCIICEGLLSIINIFSSLPFPLK